jgi:Tol biopolymer transport system component
VEARGLERKAKMRTGSVAKRLLVSGIMAASMLLATSSGITASAGKVPRIAYGFESYKTKGVFVIGADGRHRHKVSHDLRRGYGGAEDTFAPDWSGDGTRIAFGAARGHGVSHIYTVRPDGSGQTKVSRGGECFGDNHPSWSGHSNHIAFQRDDCDPVEVWTVFRSGGQQEQLTSSPDFESGLSYRPQWSPDSDSIAFYATDDNHRISVWVMDRDGSNKKELTPGTKAEIDPQWSPNSSRLVYTKIISGTRFEPDESQVCTILIAGTPSELCLTNSGAVDEDPHFSPGGNKIVFVSNRAGNRNIYVMNADGTNEHSITHTMAFDGQPEWSPDGNWIAFLSERSGHVDLYIVHPDGSGLRRLTNSAGKEDAPTWEPK